MTVRPVLSDEERFPAIADFRFLNDLRQHPLAPRFNFKSGDRLTNDDVQAVRKYRDRLKDKPVFWEQGTVPSWVNDYVETSFQSVPFYRNRTGSLENQPSVKREDLRKQPWAFVDDACNPDDLLVYETSGTTGPPVSVLFDRITQATYLPQLESVLERVQVSLPHGPGQVAMALICSQKETLTYASLSGYLGGAGILKINLHQDHWRDIRHRTGYLESLNPHILTGDPFAFTDLMRLNPSIQPKALVSSAMALLPGLKRELESFFHCPVLDVYSLTECRMVAVATDSGHRLIRPDLFAEILEPDRDVPVTPGERGELALTGGNNPFLNLIRYRTGDFCRMAHEDGGIFLRDLNGRKPVLFLDMRGVPVNTVDIYRAFCPMNLAGFQLHQNRDRSLDLCIYGHPVSHSTIRQSMTCLFGNVPVRITLKDHLPEGKTKVLPFSSDWPEDIS